jgi:hypothetical protein
MGSILVPSVPIYRNPQLRSGLAALVEHLMDRSYSSHAIGRIFDHVARNGTLEGSLVEPDDMSDAERVFVDSLPALDFDNSCWGEHDDLLPRVSGAAPEYEEYEEYQPTPEDIAELHAWSEHLERLRDIEEQRTWWAANPLHRFNDERTD